MRRAVLLLLACFGGAAGCGLIAGLDEQFGYQGYYLDSGGDGTSDGTLAHDAADDGAARSDAYEPPDVTIADVNEPPPDAYEAGCPNPPACDDSTMLCCAPGVCNAAAKCVSSCQGKSQNCGNAAACCFGLACTEKLDCETSCVGDLTTACSADNPCCVGLVCPPRVDGARCQQCLPLYWAPCRADWECCAGRHCKGVCL